ncbi:uncharacterized protein LOC130357277 [Hyla sarda]|uniref:uncharacterized protein LOC130357277 n=1 Tax=Hyla sarda TaxID=327740 RepID=UPI0024C3D180|nr:uncharacterized protein LOC130357277 [Hyla sarda]XP_056415885.1 uncharacterized protein LOC130357277 [Hyla sarda]XP_056415886.1 uncharacterized protein LOC130357277 [Hyla sarda]
MEAPEHVPRTWTVMEIQGLMDLIRDMGFTQILAGNRCQNLEVYETLCMLLARRGIQISPLALRTHWRVLKSRYWNQKRLVDAGAMPLCAASVDCPFYEDMEQLLSPEGRDRCWRREADSSGLEAPDSPSIPTPDSEDHTTSTNSPEADEGAGTAEGAPPGDVPGNAAGTGGPVVMLCHTVDRLVDVVARLSDVSEQLSIQLGYICSAPQRMTRQPYSVPSERRHPRRPAHNLAGHSISCSETLGQRPPMRRRGLGRLGRHHP